MFALSATGMYSMMANNAAYSMMMGSNARLGLMGNSSGGAISFQGLANMDTQYALQMARNSLDYKVSKAMLESLKKLQNEEIKHSFDTFA